MTTTQSPTPPSAENWASSFDEIQQLRLIYATLPTGAKMVLRTLTLDELAAVDGLPDDLLRVALLEMDPRGGIAGEIARLVRRSEESEDDTSVEEAQKLSQANVQLVNRLVQAAVVEPPLTLEQTETLDGFDKAMIAGIASRRIGFDAAGRRVGVEPLDTLATFRAKHGCAEDCSGCQETLLELSTAQPV